jgi:hypothetical protein
MPTASSSLENVAGRFAAGTLTTSECGSNTSFLQTSGGPRVRMAASVDQKLRAQTKFPPEFNQKVDMQKVNVEVMKKSVSHALRGWKLTSVTDGSQARLLKFLETKMMWLSSCASIFSRVRVT